MSSPPSWLNISPAPPATSGFSHLDPGKVEAILLAETIGADALLMDDRAGIIAARKRGLSTIGTLGVLNRAAQRGIVDLRRIDPGQFLATNGPVGFDRLIEVVEPPRLLRSLAGHILEDLNFRTGMPWFLLILLDVEQDAAVSTGPHTVFKREFKVLELLLCHEISRVRFRAEQDAILDLPAVVDFATAIAPPTLQRLAIE